MLIPLFDLAISILRKYHICPKSLISKYVAKVCWSLSISSVSSPVIIISSTYTIQIVFLPFPVCRKSIVWSDFSCWYPCFLTSYANILNHALNDCMRPYSDFFSLHIILSPSLLNLGGMILKTSFPNFPFRKAFLMSKANPNLLLATREPEFYLVWPLV